MYIYIHICIHIYIFTCMYIYIYTYVCICMYIYTYVFMCVYTYYPPQSCITLNLHCFISDWNRTKQPQIFIVTVVKWLQLPSNLQGFGVIHSYLSRDSDLPNWVWHRKHNTWRVLVIDDVLPFVCLLLRPHFFAGRDASTSWSCTRKLQLYCCMAVASAWTSAHLSSVS